MQKYVFFDGIKRFFSLNKAKLIFSILAISLGVLTGILCVAKAKIVIVIGNLQSISEKLFFVFGWPTILVFFAKILLIAALLLLIFWLSHLKIGLILNTALLIYLGYALGVDMSVVLCTMIGLKGILNAILLFVIQFVNLLLLFVFAIQMSKFCWQKNVFGNCLVCGKEGNIILFFCC